MGTHSLKGRTSAIITCLLMTLCATGATWKRTCEAVTARYRRPEPNCVGMLLYAEMSQMCVRNCGFTGPLFDCERMVSPAVARAPAHDLTDRLFAEFDRITCDRNLEAPL